MALTSRDERRMVLAFKTLAEFWPHLVIPSRASDDEPMPGIVMYRDLDGALRVRAALDEEIKSRTS